MNNWLDITIVMVGLIAVGVVSAPAWLVCSPRRVDDPNHRATDRR